MRQTSTSVAPHARCTYNYTFSHNVLHRNFPALMSLASAVKTARGQIPLLNVPFSVEEAGDLREGTPEEVQLHLDVMSYITNFIRTGKPGFDDRHTLEWPR